MVILLTSVISAISIPVWASNDIVPANLGKQFDLKINQTVNISSEDLTIKILKIQDSRCATGVICIWAGVATALIDIQKGEDHGNFNLTSKGSVAGISSINFKNYTLTMLQVAPYPQHEKIISQSDYTVTLIVTNSGTLSPLQQFRSGISANDITCKTGLTLVIKNSDGSPACVKPATAPVLVARGWARTILNVSGMTHASMLERGGIAMGFNQSKITHHFMSTPTGGMILITALDPNDTQTKNEIKYHLSDIEQEFSKGNFTKPFYIHSQVVPGTDVMAKKKDLIVYSTQQINDGAILVLSTNDTQLIDAIKQFMDFQGAAHQGH